MEKNLYFGIVENRQDPLKMGRCQVRIFGVHSESKANVPTEDLPWATPVMPISSASLSGIGQSPTGPIEGTMVLIAFQDPDSKQVPVMLGTIPAIPKNKALGGDFATSDIPNLNFVETEQMSVLTDSNDMPVTDSSGNPVLTDTPEPVNPVPITPNNGTISGELNIDKYIQKFGEICKTVTAECKERGITNPYAINAILANIAKESSFKVREENLNYTSAERLRKVFPSKFANKTDEELQPFLRNPEALANQIYSGREGNKDDEGFKYRGRGFLQITFKNNYSAIGNKIGVDLVNNPERMLDPVISAKAAVQFFLNNTKLNVLNTYKTQAEANRGITRTVVGSRVNLDAGIGAEQLEKVRQYSTYGVVGSAIATVNDPLMGKTTQNLETKKATEITNTGANEQGVVLSPVTGSGDSGFGDPNGVYPRYFNEQDVNRLARGEKKSLTIVPEKEKFLKSIKDVPKANGKGTWSAPEDPYNARYPYNHVHETESGHVMEFDDTPDNERVHIYHRKGSYIEFDPNGTGITRIVGDKYEILERDGYLKVFGNVVIQVDGDANIVVNNNCDLQVDGDLTADIGNDLIADVQGSSQISVAEQAYIKAEEIRLESYASNFEISSAGNLNITAAGDVNIKAGAALNLESAADLNVKSSALLNLDAASDANLKSGSAANIQSGGAANILAGGDVSFDGSNINLNSGVAGAASSAAASKKALNTGLATPPPRLTPSEVKFAKLTLPPKNFEELSKFEEGEDAPPSYTFELQRKGLIDEDPIPAVIGESEKVIPADIAKTTVSCDVFINQTSIPTSLMLSPTVKLFDLCSSASAGGKVVSQVGLTEGQIVCNLKNLAVNVIEPIKSRYKVIITSAFRRGSGTSQHNKGQAADFVFSGKTPAEVIEIAKDLAKTIPFDQMILEYLPSKRTAGNQPTVWLHISYRSDGKNRKQIFTMSDNKTIANSLQTGELVLVS